MSDLAEIAAAAGISIEGEIMCDGGDADRNPVPDNNTRSQESWRTKVDELEELFSNRYTEEDPEFLRNEALAKEVASPPCVKDFRPKRGNRNRNPREYRGRDRPNWSGDGNCRNRRDRRDDSWRRDRSRSYGDQWNGRDRDRIRNQDRY